MTAITKANAPPSAWRAQEGESAIEHLRFLHWALMGGDLEPELASRFRWTERRNVIEAYEAIESVPPGEQALEAVIAAVNITLVEVSKLRRTVLENPDNVLTPGEVMSRVEWLSQKSEDYAKARAESMDWSALTADERETMIAAKAIQDRLLGKA